MKWLATLLVAAIAIDAPARAFAQAGSGQPARAQVNTAARLANVPDAISYEANPYAQVPQTRTMSTAIKEALENVGIDTRQGSAKYDEAPTSDTVRFEGEYEDGDIIVTGRLVNGRIVLTKQFKPLLPSGELGAAVTIAFNPAPAAVATTSPAPGGGPAGDLETAALNSALEAELRSAYNDVIKQARALQGERNIGGIAIADATLIYAILTRNMYAFQLAVHLARLAQFTAQTRVQKIAHIQHLQALARRIQYWTGIRAYLGAVSQTEQGQRFLREQADREGRDTEKSDALLNMANHPEAWSDLVAAEIFKLFDEDPLVASSQFFLEQLSKDAPPGELLQMYDDALASETAKAQKEVSRVRALNTVEQMTEFFRPQYVRTRGAAAGLLGQFSLKLYEPFEAFARSYEEHRGIRRDPLGLNTPLAIGGLLILSLVVPANMPVLLAIVVAADAAATGYALYHDTPYLLELGTAQANARRGRAVLGHQPVLQMNDEVLKRAVGLILSGLGVAVAGRALTRSAAEARAGEMLRRARMQNTTAGSRADAVAAAPPAGAPGARPAPAAADATLPPGVTADRAVPPGSVAPARSASGGNPIDRAAETVIDLPAARADAAALAVRRDDLNVQLATVKGELSSAAVRENPQLVQRRSAVQQQLAELDAERAELVKRMDRALPESPRGPATNVDRNAVTAVDLRSARTEAADVSRRHRALAEELNQIDRQLSNAAEERFPQLAQRRHQLENDLRSVQMEQAELAALIGRGNDASAGARGIGISSTGPDAAFDVEAAAERVARNSTERARLMDERTALIAQAKQEATPAARQALEQRAENLQKRTNDLLDEQAELLKQLDQNLNAADLEDAVDALRKEMARAQATVPQEQIDEITRGFERVAPADVDDIYDMQARLAAARLRSSPGVQVFTTTNPEHAQTIELIQKDFAFVRGALVEARGTGRISDTAAAYINRRLSQDPDWFANLPKRVVEGRGEQYFMAASEDLAGELKKLFSDGGGVAGTANLGDSLQLAQKFYELGMKLKGINAPSAGDMPTGIPAPALEDAAVQDPSRPQPVGRRQRWRSGGPVSVPRLPDDPTQALAQVKEQLAANRARLTELWENGAIIGNSKSAAMTEDERDDMRKEYRVLQDQRDVMMFQLNTLSIITTYGARGSERTVPGNFEVPMGNLPDKRLPKVDVSTVKTAEEPEPRPRTGGTPAPGTAAGGTASTAKEVSGLPSPPSAPSPPGTPASGTAVAFADRVPDGPAFAISGAEKPKTSDSPVTAGAGPVTPPMTTIDVSSGDRYNPAITSSAVKVRGIQDTVAEGQEIVVPGSSGQQQEASDALGRRFPWSPRSIVEAITGLLLPRDVRASRHIAGTRLQQASRPSGQQRPDAAAPPTSSPPVKIILTSLGRSSGDAFQMTVINEGPSPVRLTGDAFVLEPVGRITQAAIDRELGDVTHAGRATTTLKAYCLEFLKQPPTSGMVFRLAPDAVQKRSAGIARIFDATRRLRELGRMQPSAGDPSDPADYFDAIRQWTIWTREQGFDERRFTEAFVAHARKNLVSNGERWSNELQKAFRGLAPGRWQAVQMVLREAAALDRQ